VFGMAWDLEVTRHALGLPATVAQMSDLHLDRVCIAPARVATALDRAGAEVVVLTGDFFDTEYLPDRLEAWLDALGGRPCAAVLGNHDYRLGTAGRRDLVGRLEARGIRVLRNEAATVGGVRLYGLDDPVTWHAQEEPPADPCDLVLAHSVDLQFPVAQLPAPLLCGHYHGGQFRFAPNWVIARLVLRREPFALATGILSGWTPDRRAYIHRGLGMSHISARLRSAPEIAVFA